MISADQARRIQAAPSGPRSARNLTDAATPSCAVAMDTTAISAPVRGARAGVGGIGRDTASSNRMTIPPLGQDGRAFR